MKKTIAFLSSLVISASLSAQLYVNQDGNVGIYSTFSNTSLNVKTNNNSNGIRITGPGSNSIQLYNSADSTVTSNNFGIRIYNQLKDNVFSQGINVYPYGESNRTNIGVKAFGGNSSTLSIGIAGCLNGNNITNGAGVYGSSSMMADFVSPYFGEYAGYFRGDVRVTGSLYANLLTPSATSSSSGNSARQYTSVQVMSGNMDAVGESISEKLSQVQLLRINNDRPGSQESKIKSTGRSAEIERLEQAILDGKELSAEDIEALEKSDEEEDVPQTQMASVRYGLATDQLKEVFPELVYEDANGNVSINYIEMVPLLVQSINELQQRIEVLEDENASLKECNTQAVPSRKKSHIADIPIAATDIISLGQNHPNPFTEKTSIDVSLPETVRTAALFIYDMSGKQVDKIAIADRGKSSVSVSATGLHEGMYLYSLIADGKVIDTRKMILTK